MQFAGKVALVTGGGSGIGKATCELFAGRGGAVVAADVNEAAAAATAEGIRKTGGRAIAVRCDVTVGDQIQAAVDRARKEYGSLDVVVNCAGILKGHLLEETPEAEWRQMLDVNLTGAFLVTKAALKAMREQGGGAIVHIASRMAIRVKEGHGAYAAAKAGILQLTQMAALEGRAPQDPGQLRLPWFCGFADDARRIPGRRVRGLEQGLSAGAARRPPGHRQGDALPGLGRGRVHHRGGVAGGRGADDSLMSRPIRALSLTGAPVPDTATWPQCGVRFGRGGTLSWAGRVSTVGCETMGVAA